jgi:hypothetical protein
MSSTYSPNLRVELIGSGDQAGTWGTTTDNNFAYIFDAAIAGYQAVTVTSTAQALTYINGPTSSAALNQSIYAILKFNSAAAASAIYAPPVSKQYIIWNNSSFAITIYNSTVIGNTTAAGTGIAIAAGNKIQVWSDGTNFYDVQAQNLTGTLAIANGGTGQITANAAFNALAPSQTSANGKYLKSDGTNASWDALDISTGDITGILPVLNGGTGVTTSTGSGNNVLSTSATLTTPTLTSPTINTATLTTPTFSTYGNIKALFETATVTASAPASTTNFDVVTQAVQYYTSNAGNNFTLNIRGDGSTSLNSILTTGQSVTIALLVTNGGNAYYPSLFRIDGSGAAIDLKWQTGTAPTGGNANSIDVYTYAIVKTASATFTVLASQVKFA